MKLDRTDNFIKELIELKSMEFDSNDAESKLKILSFSNTLNVIKETTLYEVKEKVLEAFCKTKCPKTYKNCTSKCIERSNFYFEMNSIK